jgi:hypothetical protein
MTRLSAQERQWRKEEREDLIRDLAEANRHRPNCLCRAVREWSDGPACYQQVRG